MRSSLPLPVIFFLANVIHPTAFSEDNLIPGALLCITIRSVNSPFGSTEADES